MPAALTTRPDKWIPSFTFNAGTGVITIDLADLPGLTAAEAEDDFRKLMLALLQKLRGVYQQPVDEAAAFRFDTRNFTLSENVAPITGIDQLIRTLLVKIHIQPGTEEVIEGDPYVGP